MTPKLRARVDFVTGVDATYDPVSARSICQRIATGEGLHKICTDLGMPPVSTVLTWAQDPDLPFGEMYQHACETAQSKWAEEVIDLADNVAPDRDAISKTVVQIKSRQWLLEKLNPGFARRSELTGRGGGPIAIVTREMTDIELAREVAFLLNKPKDSVTLDARASDVIDIEADGKK